MISNQIFHRLFVLLALIINLDFSASPAIIQQSIIKQFNLKTQTINDGYFLQKCSTNTPKKIIVNLVGDFPAFSYNAGLGQINVNGDAHIYTFFEQNQGKAYDITELDKVLRALATKSARTKSQSIDMHLVGHSRGATAILDLYSLRTKVGALYPSAQNCLKNIHLILSPSMSNSPALFKNLLASKAKLTFQVGTADNEDCLSAVQIFASNNYVVEYIPQETHLGIVNNPKAYEDFLLELGLSLEK